MPPSEEHKLTPDDIETPTVTGDTRPPGYSGEGSSPDPETDSPPNAVRDEGGVEGEAAAEEAAAEVVAAAGEPALTMAPETRSEESPSPVMIPLPEAVKDTLRRGAIVDYFDPTAEGPMTAIVSAIVSAERGAISMHVFPARSASYPVRGVLHIEAAEAGKPFWAWPTGA